MAKYKLAISIPTYERPDCIKEIVDYMIVKAERLNVGIYVFDGSEQNNETYEICKKYEKYRCFNYIKHSGTIAKRHCEAIYKPDCEYLWLTRDRTILKTDFWPILLCLLQQQKDLYVIADLPSQDHIKLYTDPVELIFDFGKVMTFFGSYLVKKSFLQNIEESNESYLRNFPLVYKVFASAASATSNFSALYLPFRLNKNYFTIQTKFGHPCMHNIEFLETWAKNWVLFIDNLPPFYNAYKTRLKMMRKDDLWSFFYFLTLRKKREFNLKEFLKYKQHIIQVTKIPWIVMVILLILPHFVAHFIRELCRPFERIVRHKREREEQVKTR